jgi:hypothetical protein
MAIWLDTSNSLSLLHGDRVRKGGIAEASAGCGMNTRLLPVSALKARRTVDVRMKVYAAVLREAG